MPDQLASTDPTPALARPIYCYVASAESEEIAVFLQDPASGQLQAVQTLALGGPVMPLAVSLDQRYLFAMLRSLPYRVASLRIDPANGRLSPISSTELPGNMAYITLDRSGKFLFAIAPGENLLSISAVDSEGRVSAALCLRATAAKPHSVALDQSNQWVLVTSLLDNTISQWRFDPGSAQLLSAEPSVVAMATNGGPRHVTFSPDNRHVYVVNERDGKLEALSFDVESGLGFSEQSVSVLATGIDGIAQGADLHVAGRFLYASERLSNTITGYRVAADGCLDLIGHFPTALQPRGFHLDPSGKFLVAAGQRSRSVMVHRIAADSGSLSEVESVTVGNNPNWVEFAQP